MIALGKRLPDLSKPSNLDAFDRWIEVTEMGQVSGHEPREGAARAIQAGHPLGKFHCLIGNVSEVNDQLTKLHQARRWQSVTYEGASRAGSCLDDHSQLGGRATGQTATQERLSQGTQSV